MPTSYGIFVKSSQLVEPLLVPGNICPFAMFDPLSIFTNKIKKKKKRIKALKTLVWHLSRRQMKEMSSLKI